ncbi:MAG: addiction module protein [Nocardioidaceae bacterium]
MTAEPSEVVRAGMSLPPADREAVALTLLDSLDGDTIDQTQIDSAWDTEIKRRVDEIRRGNATMLSGKEVDAMIESALAASER